jgi:hypothetical protein
VREDRDRTVAEKDTWVDSPRGLKGKRSLWSSTWPWPYQVDPKITRPELVGAHTKWLYCSSAFWVLSGGQCETSQKFVPDGYWFETGRPVPAGTNCSALTGEGDVPVVNCRFKRGLKMVLPVVNYQYVACTDGRREDPRLGVEEVMNNLFKMQTLKATLDGAKVASFDVIPVATQDGDADYTLPTPSSRCIDFLGIFRDYGGCPLFGSGQYAFIDTTNLTKGKHELVLIGGFVDSPGCSAVKHVFTLY